ncbi:(4Fe-4S)-binding protein [Deinococcus budaensis]|uniref:Putative Fe-S cluster protein YjdI/CDGSH-type Zn-finger protein n=1 Tax=Deinococcus budaensis TaxID=1665626 RepID=A0A7W8LQ70_9DEIO|nr:(4Fe-4S)-binding protein [Deinococcus budaensis]MBB5234516.1 putative Fe-S cluster protein YjdI/CDGSH-type Zn-finger protein [Deinococcus budaensis]
MTQDPVQGGPLPDDLARGKAYAGDEVTVYYDAPRCVHVANCVRGLPAVFRPRERPWIQVWNEADAARVAEVVRTCPTGALHYALHGAPPEAPAVPTTITPVTDGPLTLRGDLRLQTPAGELREVRAALCRCGASGNKPFCDGTHARIGWKSDQPGGQAPPDQRGDGHPEEGQQADGARRD